MQILLQKCATSGAKTLVPKAKGVGTMSDNVLEQLSRTMLKLRTLYRRNLECTALKLKLHCGALDSLL
eukprot:328538-Amphidinium_carterae.1